MPAAGAAALSVIRYPEMPAASVALKAVTGMVNDVDVDGRTKAVMVGGVVSTVGMVNALRHTFALTDLVVRSVQLVPLELI